MEEVYKQNLEKTIWNHTVSHKFHISSKNFIFFIKSIQESVFYWFFRKNGNTDTIPWDRKLKIKESYQSID